MNGFSITWTPPPSGWRGGLFDRLLVATRLIPGRPLEARLLAWMGARGHLVTLHARMDPGVILARAGVDLCAGEAVTFVHGTDRLPTVVPLHWHSLSDRVEATP